MSAWKDCLFESRILGCTNYGLTRNSLEKCVNRLKIAMDEVQLNLSMFSELVLNDEDEIFNSIFKSYSEILCIGADNESLRKVIKENIETFKQRKNDYIKPNALHLDHIFLREGSDRLTITESVCPHKSETISRLESNPIPNIEKGEPSDHLSISVSLRFA